MSENEKDITIQSRQILVVDDEPLMKDFLCETLSRKDYDVDSASDGTEAIRKIKERIYDLVLTDRAVSRHHAEIQRVGSEFILADVGSKNGTYHNGQRVESVPLRDGDRIQVGSVTLTFQVG